MNNQIFFFIILVLTLMYMFPVEPTNLTSTSTSTESTTTNPSNPPNPSNPNYPIQIPTQELHQDKYILPTQTSKSSQSSNTSQTSKSHRYVEYPEQIKLPDAKKNIIDDYLSETNAKCDDLNGEKEILDSIPYETIKRNIKSKIKSKNKSQIETFDTNYLNTFSNVDSIEYAQIN